MYNIIIRRLARAVVRNVRETRQTKVMEYRLAFVDVCARADAREIEDR